jgi:heptosyltransferase-3
MSDKIKKIFFVRSDRLGEFLLSLFAVKLVKSNYPESSIYLLAKKENIELIRGVDFIDYFLEYEDNVFKGYKGAVNLSRILRKEKIDCLIALNPKKEFHLAPLLALVKLRVGYDRKFGFCLNRKIKDEKYKGVKHEAEYNLDLMRLLCRDVYVPDINLAIDRSDMAKNTGEEAGAAKKYIVIHPFTSNPSKKIDTDFWTELCRRLKHSCERDIAIIGSKDEMNEGAQLAQNTGAENLTGKLSLRNLAAFLKYNCDVFIGLDSGPMHLASMFKLPVVGLFKASDCRRWAPFNTRSLIVQSKTDDGFKQKIEDIVKFTCPNQPSKI